MKRLLAGIVAMGLIPLAQPVSASSNPVTNLPVLGALISGHGGSTLSGLLALGGVVKLEPGTGIGLLHDAPLISEALASTGVAELSSLPGLSKLQLKLPGTFTDSSTYSGLQNITGGNVLAAIIAGLPVTATSATDTVIFRKR